MSDIEYTRYSDQMSNEEEYSIHDLIDIVMTHIKIILAITIVAGLLAFLISYFLISPQYEANVKLFINNNIEVHPDAIGLSDATAPERLVNTYMEIVKSNDVLDEVSKNIAKNEGLTYSVEMLTEIISTEAVKNTGIFYIKVISSNPHHSQILANQIAEDGSNAIMNFSDGIEDIYVKIFDLASLPKERISPNIRLNTMIGFVLGFILSVFIVFLLNMLDMTIRSEDDFKYFTDIPILGVIPNIDSDSCKSKKAVKTCDTTLLRDGKIFHAEEAYKALRTNLMFLVPDAGCKVIGITSAIPKEGKSITSLNLAIAFAQTGAKILLIDSNMRLPNISVLLNVKSTSGLSDVLAGITNVSKTIQSSGYEGLDIIFSGNVPPNPAELLASDNMKNIINELKRTYDYVFIDTPPMNVVTDATVITRLLHGTILVTRENESKKYEVKEALNKLQFVNAKILGFVLNDRAYHGKSSYFRGYGHNSKINEYCGLYSSEND